MHFLGSFRILVSVTQMAFRVNYSLFSDLRRLFLDSKTELMPWFCCVIAAGRDHTKVSVMSQLPPGAGGAAQAQAECAGVGTPEPGRQLGRGCVSTASARRDEIACARCAPGPGPSMRPPLQVIHHAPTPQLDSTEKQLSGMERSFQFFLIPDDRPSQAREQSKDTCLRKRTGITASSPVGAVLPSS